MHVCKESHRIALNVGFYIRNCATKEKCNVLMPAERERYEVVYEEFVLKIQLERRPRFYSMLFLLPSVLLYLLAPFVFLLPVESGEKTSMSLTVLLSEVVFMGNISAVLPESSNNFPVITSFLATSVLQMGINTILTILGQ